MIRFAFQWLDGVGICLDQFPRFNPLSVNTTKWSNTHKQLVGSSPTNSLSVFDHFVGLALKGLRVVIQKSFLNHIFCTGSAFRFVYVLICLLSCMLSHW